MDPEDNDNSYDESEAPDLLEPGDSDDSESKASESSTGEEYREALRIVCNLNDIFIVPELEEGVIPSNEECSKDCLHHTSELGEVSTLLS